MLCIDKLAQKNIDSNKQGINKNVNHEVERTETLQKKTKNKNLE